MTAALVMPRAEILKLSVPEYDALPRLRSTALKTLIDKSAKHFKHEESEPKETTDAMRRGIATHAALFEPEVYRQEVVTADMAGTKSAAWAAFVARNPGKTPILLKDEEAIEAMVAAVRADEAASMYLHGQPEMTIVWTDSLTGIECKARVDLLDESDPQNPIIIGLKTTRGLGRAFDRQVDEFLYHVTWAMYRDGYYHVRGVYPEMVEIVVESTAPYDVGTYRIGDEALQAGENLYRQGLAKLAECRRTGRWPGVTGGLQELVLKKWVRGMHQDEDFEVMNFNGVES